MTHLKQLFNRVAVGFIGLCYGQVGFAGLIPKFKGADDIANGTKDGLDLLADKAKTGMSILVFIVAVVSIVYGAETCMQGVREGQKNEASIGTLARYIVTGVIGVVLGLLLCYLAWYILAGFDINSIDQ